jgi:hypothetical protein
MTIVGTTQRTERQLRSRKGKGRVTEEDIEDVADPATDNEEYDTRKDDYPDGPFNSHSYIRLID